MDSGSGGRWWWGEVVVGRGGGEMRIWQVTDEGDMEREREEESVEWRFNKILQIRIFARVV